MAADELLHTPAFPSSAFFCINFINIEIPSNKHTPYSGSSDIFLKRRTGVSMYFLPRKILCNLTSSALLHNLTENESKSSPSERSVTEIVIRTIATHLFAVANYGHMGSLLNMPGDFHAGCTLTFLFYPSIITGQLVIGLLQATRYLIREKRKGEGDASFWILS